MVLPSISKLQELTRVHVLDSDKNGKLHTLTPKLMRRDIEKELELEEGSLDVPEYRNSIKQAIESTMAELQSDKDVEEEEEEKPKKAVKRKQVSAKKDTPDTKKRKSDAGNDGSSGKKPRVNAPKSSTEIKKPKEGKSKGIAKKATLPVDDSDRNEEEDEKPSQVSQKKKKARVEDSEPEYGSPRVSKPDSKIEKLQSKSPGISKSEGNAVPSTKEPDMDTKSESELSVLIDESPKPKRKKAKSTKDNSKPEKTTTSKAKSKSSTSLSKDDEAVKKLKSLVLACGVRKVWSKFFQGADTPSQQVKKLQELLRDLGMTGRLSMEQAKTIKAKRELEQELNDVKEFEKSVTRRGARKSSTDEEDSAEENGGDEDEDDEGDNPKPRRKAMNARQSIMAFLDDQSDDD